MHIIIHDIENVSEKIVVIDIQKDVNGTVMEIVEEVGNAFISMLINLTESRIWCQMNTNVKAVDISGMTGIA